MREYKEVRTHITLLVFRYYKWLRNILEIPMLSEVNNVFCILFLASVYFDPPPPFNNFSKSLKPPPPPPVYYEPESTHKAIALGKGVRKCRRHNCFLGGGGGEITSSQAFLEWCSPTVFLVRNSQLFSATID